jgi:hypothetical protein
VAEWEDGVPMAAVRYDLPGLITSLGFYIGTNEVDCMDLIINAIALDR